MTAKIISSIEIAQHIREEIKQEVVRLKEDYNIVPSLVTIMVGENPASMSYVIAKRKTSKELGYQLIQENQLESIKEEQLVKLIDKYNKDPKVHGIIIQLPLPNHISETKVLYAIDPKKDVDGVHPANVGKLMIGEADYLPCTPSGIQQLLIRSGVKIEGAEVVVLGRSNIVGKLIANILLQKKKGANATVTICHTGTRDIASHIRRADILIVATGKPKEIAADMVKEGAVVIDAGVHRTGMTPEGKTKFSGNVDFDTVKKKIVFSLLFQAGLAQ
jgi:methylenetetrahydrofolate dehydrogenase (NADP+)/methenyltetrahydrofolate cyclohydrolase